MNIFKNVTKGVSCLLVAVNLHGCASPEIKSGYNALETAVTNQRSVRNRILVNQDFGLEKVGFGYHALAELDNLDEKTHYGRHAMTVRIDKKLPQAIAVLKTGSSGITDAKYGIRTNLNKLGGYGFADITTDSDSSNVSLFYGREIFPKFSVEVYEDVEFPFNGNPTPYTELQVNRILGKRLSAFGRVETTEFDTKNTRYLFGLAVSF